MSKNMTKENELNERFNTEAASEQSQNEGSEEIKMSDVMSNILDILNTLKTYSME